MKTIQSPLIYFGNRKHSQQDGFEIIQLYQEQKGRFRCFYDLFAGSGSLSLYAMQYHLADFYVMNDLFAPLSAFWQQVQKDPQSVIKEYKKLVRQYESCPLRAEQKQSVISSAHKKKPKKKQSNAELPTRADFYQQLQNQLNRASDTEKNSAEYVAHFAFIINHAQNGMPLLSKQDAITKLDCQLTKEKDNLSIDVEFAERVNLVHQLFKKNKVTFNSRDFRSFDDEIFLETKGSGHDLVLLDPPYPDMPDAEQQPAQHIYQRSEPKAQLQEKLDGLIKILTEKNISFMMFYGVLGMENPCPVYWPQGHVLHRVGSNPPYQAYVEHLYLSPSLAPFIPKHQKTIQPLFHQLVETHAQIGPFQNGNRTALAWEEQGTIRTLTYAKLNRAANRLAHYLLQQGLEEKLKHRLAGQEPLVALYLDRGPTLIISLLAIIKTGAAFLPIETNQNRLELSVAYQRIQQSQACMVLTDRQKMPPSFNSLSSESKWIPVLLDPQRDPDAEQLTAELKEQQFSQDLNRPIEPDDLAYVMYTSGSTGVPKGVEILQRGLPYAFESHQDLLNLGPEDRVAQFASIGFDASMMEIMLALGSGAELHLVDDHQYSDSGQLTQFLQKHQITIAIQTPKMLAGLIPEQFPLLRGLLIVGDSFTKDLSDQWITPIQVQGQTILRQVVNGYGLTETTICTTLDPCSKDKPLTIGKPILGLEVFLRSIADEEKNLDWQANDWQALLTLQASRKNRAEIIGEYTKMAFHLLNIVDEYLDEPLKGTIYASGACLARGYWQRPDLTQMRFREVKIAGQQKLLYQTGDVGYYLADGSLVFTGRIDRQVKIRGQRVELGEIEAIMLKTADPAVQEVRVIAYTPQQDGKSVSTEKRLVAYLVPKQSELVIPGNEPSSASLAALKKIRNHLRQHALSSMCPALNHMTFVASLPRKKNDKNSVDDVKLAERPVPCITLSAIEQKNPGRTPDECALLDWLRQQWAKCLDLPFGEIPYEDHSFADLSGDSLRVRQCVTLIHDLAHEQRGWSLGLRGLVALDILNHDLLKVMQIVQQKQTANKQKAQEYKKLTEVIPAQTQQRFLLDIDKIHEAKIYEKNLLPFYCIHSLLGDADLDYGGTVLQNLNWYFTPLNSPAIEILNEWEEDKSFSLLNRLVLYHSENAMFCQTLDMASNPYWLLLGWSSGGLIASLIADKLRKKGEQVFTFLLDTHHPRLLRSMNQSAFAQALIEIAEKIIESVKKYLKIPSFTLAFPHYTSLIKLPIKRQIDLLFNTIMTDFNDQLKNQTYRAEEIVTVKKMIRTAELLLIEELNYPIDQLPLLTSQDTLIITTNSQKKSSLPHLGWEIKDSSAKVILLEATHFDLLYKTELQEKLTQEIVEKIKILKNPKYQGLTRVMDHIQTPNQASRWAPNMQQFVEFYDGFSEMRVNPKNISGMVSTRDADWRTLVAEAAIKKFDPDQALSYVHRGIVRNSEKSFIEAISDFSQAIALDAKCVEAYFKRGLVYLNLNRNKMALKDFQHCITTKEQSYLDTAYFYSAVIKVRLNNYDEALIDVNQAIQPNNNDLDEKDYNSNLSRRYSLRSLIYERLEMYSYALVDLDQAITLSAKSKFCLSKEDATLYERRGSLKRRLNMKKEAILDYSQAIEIYSSKIIIMSFQGKNTLVDKAGSRDAVDSYFCRGSTQLELKEFVEAVKDFNSVISINPNYWKAYQLRGLAHFALRNFTDCVGDLTSYLKKYPNDSQAATCLKQAKSYLASDSKLFLSRAMLKAEQEDYKGAIADYNSYLTEYKESEEGYLNRGLAKAWSGDYSGAILDYNRCVEINPKTQAYSNRAAARLQLEDGDAELALDDLNYAVLLGQRNDFVYHQLAIARVKLNLHQLAIEACDRSIQLNPQYDCAYATRGSLRDGQGSYLSAFMALTDYNMAIQWDSRNEGPYLNRAFLNFKLGYYQQAVEDCDWLINRGEQNITIFQLRFQANQSYSAVKEQKLQDDKETVILNFNANSFAYVERLTIIIDDELILINKRTLCFPKAWLKQLNVSAINELADGLDQPLLRSAVRDMHLFPNRYTLFRFKQPSHPDQEIKASIDSKLNHHSVQDRKSSFINKKTFGLIGAGIGFFTLGGIGGFVLGGLLGISSEQAVNTLQSNCKKREKDKNLPHSSPSKIH